MPLKLKSAKFDNNTVYTDNRKTKVLLEPTADGDDFDANHCVKVVDRNDPTRYWGGKLKSIQSGRVWKAILKYQADKCSDNGDGDASRADDDGSLPFTPGDTTDVSVTIENPATGQTDEVVTQNVSVLP